VLAVKNADRETMVSVENLSKIFYLKGSLFRKKRAAVHAVNNISFTIEKNSSIGIVGESGSGKTTAGKCITRLLEPTKGRIKFQGRDICGLDPARMRELRRSMQMIFQDPYASLNPRMTIADIVGEGLDIHGIAKGAERKERIAEILLKVGIMPENMKKKPHEFSGGQRQRIGIARAMIFRPKLVVADEPVSALDVSIQAQVINLLMELKSDFNLTYAIISHDLSVVRHMCDKIAVMYLGSIVELSESEAFYENPRHPYSETLLQAVPIPMPGRQVKRNLLDGDMPSPRHLPEGCLFFSRCPIKDEGICARVRPELTEIGENHFIACHLRGA
jgi:peptide/nickel transport system ATP-binding protein